MVIQTPKCNVVNQAVYHTMKRMPNLESLPFALPSTASIAGLEYPASTLRHRSNLRILSIDGHFSGNQCPRAWRAVARLSNLRELFMQLRGATLDQEFVAFIEALAHGCPELRELSLESPTEFPIEIISNFPLYPNLQNVTLGNPNFWDDSLLDIFKCPSLEALRIAKERMSAKVAAALAYLTR